MNLQVMAENVCDACDVPMGTHRTRAVRLCNASLLELCSMLRLTQPLLTVTVIPFQGDYSIASGLGVANAAQIRDLFYQPIGQTQAGPPLERTSPSRIDDIRARAVSNTYPMQYAIAGIDTLMLGPNPSDAGTLSVRVVSDGDQLSADSDSPATLPGEYQDLVWLGAAIQLAAIKRPAVIDPLQKLYDRRLGDLRSWIVDLGGSKPMRMQRRGDTIPNRDPSIYPVVQSY